MPENYGLIVDPAKNVIKQLFARNTEVKARHCILAAAGLVYERGCLVQGATADAVFTKVVTPAGVLSAAATDILGIVTERVDATGADTKAAIYVSGEFVKEAVFGASGVIDAAGILAVTELALAQGINLVPASYGDIPGAY